MKKRIFFMGGILLPFFSLAQVAYKPGDTVTNLRQYVPNPKKLVIFDFWGLGCSVCIEQFPKLDSLQRIFKDEIDIVLVNQDNLSDSNQVNKYVRRTSLQSVSGDSTFVKSFPHISVPHYVWTNSEGKIVGQTHASHMTEKNIRLVLSRELPSLFTKTETYRYLPGRDSLAAGRFRSIITPEQSHLCRGSGNLIDLNESLTVASYINGGLKDLTTWAYLYERKKPKHLPKNDSSYCYELVIPPTPYKEAYRIVQADLERYFGIKRPKYGFLSRKKFLKDPK